MQGGFLVSLALSLIIIAGAHLPAVPAQEAMSGCPPCTGCDCTLNTTTSLPMYSCQGLKNVPKCFPANTSFIGLGGNLLSTVNKNDFTGLAQLQELLLFDNALTHIDDGALDGLLALRTVNLYNNGITQITRNLFHDLPNLQVVSLFANDITELAPNTFYNLPSLENVILTRNSITMISRRAFNALPALNTVSFEDNPVAVIESEAFYDITGVSDPGCVPETPCTGIFLSGLLSGNITIANDAFAHVSAKKFGCGRNFPGPNCLMEECAGACPDPGLACNTDILAPNANFTCVTL